MDKITQSYIDSFLKSQQIKESDESKQFEMFASYCAISQVYSESFDLSDVITGAGGDCGIDGVAVIANGSLITSKDEIDDLIKLNKFLYDVSIVFIQAKRSSTFATSEMRTFGDGVLDFLAEKHALVRNKRVEEIGEIVNYVFEKATLLKKKPECILYYVTTGKWLNDKNCVAVIEKTKAIIDSEGLFANISYTPVDADLLQKYYRETIEEIEVEVRFPNAVLLPAIEHISQAYLGFLDYKEYLKLIQTDDGELRRSVFYDNIRDYQGSNPVNDEIAETIKTDANKFVLYNNGVTIICKELKSFRDNYTLNSYQIVNGCQTSHVLFFNQDTITTELLIPVKIIETKDEETVNKIIKATNRQTKVGDEQLVALNQFHRKLEEYFKAIEPNHRLYYERRSKQYSFDASIEKARIISTATEIKAVASMFFDKPNLASRYYGQLLKNVAGMFGENDKLEPYYTCAYLLYRLEFLFRNKVVSRDYRKYRFHILMMIKYDIASGSKVPRLSENKIIPLCKKINGVAADDKKIKDEVIKMTDLIDKHVSDVTSREITKSAELVEKLKKAVLSK